MAIPTSAGAAGQERETDHAKAVPDAFVDFGSPQLSPRPRK
jgi:hypothetical protein